MIDLPELSHRRKMQSYGFRAQQDHLTFLSPALLRDMLASQHPLWRELNGYEQRAYLGADEAVRIMTRENVDYLVDELGRIEAYPQDGRWAAFADDGDEGWSIH